MTYNERTGKFLVTVDDFKASIKVLGNLSTNLMNSKVARAEYISPLEHSEKNSGALASILEAPCTVKWSNSYQIKPAEEGGRCLYFVAASAGDIFVVFSAIPRDKTTWYHLQISFQGVVLYKGMKLVKYEGAKSARSLGDSKLFQPYFICIQEDMDKQQTNIKYGIGSDNSEKGLVYMVYNDNGKPLGIRFYSFGSGEKDVEIMDARIIEGGAAGQMECTGGTVMEDGICVEDCHPECNGCIPKSPGSKLDTECRLCKHLSVRKDDGSTQCVASCPARKKVAPNGVTCICEDYSIRIDDGSTRCVSACPVTTHQVATDGVTCEPKLSVNKWRDDDRCGPSYTTQTANPGQCDPNSAKPCCSSLGWCGNTANHCTCSVCRDYRWLKRDSSWVVESAGTPWVNNRVTYDATKALDGNTETYWNPTLAGRYFNNWYIILDLAAPHTLIRIAINNRGDDDHDIAAFKLQKSQGNSPYNWEDVASFTNVMKGTTQRQSFGGFRDTAEYWRFVVTRTHAGYQPYLRELNFQGFQAGTNVALGMLAFQTTTRPDGGAARLAVDGNPSTSYADGSCAHSEQEDNPTWWVDLGQSYAVDSVVIFNRRDCCSDRLNPFNIHIGDSDQVSTNPKCGGDHRIDVSQPSISVSCQGMRGRYMTSEEMTERIKNAENE
ncbi:uncharacterized protein LOC144867737 [Branchiostoma floridae x Branchiostoma japonicum]